MLISILLVSSRWVVSSIPVRDMFTSIKIMNWIQKIRIKPQK